MKLANISGTFFGIVLLTAAAIVVNVGVVSAQNKPYISNVGADVYAGGWFGNSCQSSSSYQSPARGSNLYGGILTFSRAINGSYSNYGAFALGLIEGNGTTNDFGFVSQRIIPSTPGDRLSFANNASGLGSNWGGLFGVSSCIPDYYGAESGGSTVRNQANVAIQTGKFIYNPPGPTATLGATNIAAGTKAAIFVDGNLLINGPITYPASSSLTDTNVPKLVIVVRGNIYVHPSVTRLDGFYVAQPDGSGNGGEFWSCHDGTTAPDGPSLTAGTCGGALTVNGAVVAAKVNLLRTPGNIGTPSSSEVFNFIPEMVVGGAFFTDGTNQNTLQGYDSVISLPPVF